VFSMGLTQRESPATLGPELAGLQEQENEVVVGGPLKWHHSLGEAG